MAELNIISPQYALRGSKVDSITTKNNDMKQRRVINAAPAQDSNDYVIKSQVDQSTSDLQNQVDSLNQSLNSRVITATVIKPPIDSTAAIKVTKADGQTPVLTIDTIDTMLGIGVSTRYISTSSALPTTGNTLNDSYITQDTSHLWVWNGSIWVDSGAVSGPTGPACKVDVNGSIVTRGIDSTSPIGVGYGRFSYDPTNNICDILSYNSLTGYQELTVRGSPLLLGASGGKIAFYGSTASVVQQVLISYTSNPQTIAYSGIATGTAGSPYAQVNDLNNLRLAVENLRQMCEDMRTKLRTSTIVG